jgi:hypothetical protein
MYRARNATTVNQEPLVCSQTILMAAHSAFALGVQQLALKLASQ